MHDKTRLKIQEVINTFGPHKSVDRVELGDKIWEVVDKHLDNSYTDGYIDGLDYAAVSGIDDIATQRASAIDNLRESRAI